jgi:hypothetical protein
MQTQRPVHELEGGEQFRLLHDWRFDDSREVVAPSTLRAIEVEQDGVWVRIRTDLGTLSLNRHEVVTVVDE